MKILHITDSHATVKAPASRRDIYYVAFLKKMYELKYVIKQEGINIILHTGDLFHTPNVSDKFTGILAEIIKSYGIPMYVVPGNHDIEGHTIDTLDQTKLGLLAKTGVIKILDRDHPFQIKSHNDAGLVVNIAGQEYYRDIDTGNSNDYMMLTNKPADVNILCAHGYICDKPQNPNIRYTLCKDIVTDADVILSGHFHESFVYSDRYVAPDGRIDFQNGLDVYNPGSLMRVERNEYNKTHLPQYGILDIRHNNVATTWKYTLHPFKTAEPSTEVFDYDSAYNDKQTLISIDNFKQSIANAGASWSSSLSASDNVLNIIDGVSNDLSMPEDVKNETINSYNDALNNATDTSIVQKGFVPSNRNKIISRVKIHNFQSHVDTDISFNNGLNVIVGDSNSGKTSILRAIQWVFDDTPRGDDFITTGEDECSVEVIFNDGSSIKKIRTKTDTGKYIVTEPDKFFQEFTSFANNLPIDIANVHQMPKINLANDYFTHLNVLNQFDDPFLINDSPRTRAAIIGRLTGTQVIDDAIKNVNKEILRSGSDKKHYQSEIKSRQDTLNFKYKNFDKLKKFNDRLQELNAKFNSAISTTDALDVLNAGYTLTRVQLINETYQASVLGKRVRCLNMLKLIYQHLRNWQTIIEICDRYLDTYAILESNKRGKEKYSKIISIQPIVDTAISYINDLRNIIPVYDQYTDTISNIDNNKKRAKFLITINDHLETIINYIKDNFSKLKDVHECDASLWNLSSSVDSNRASAIEDSMLIQQSQENIISYKDKQIELIRNNDICPCCQRKITSDKQAEHINTFILSIKKGDFE